MAVVSVYIEQGAAPGGTGTSVSPYDSIADMLSTVVADTALTSLNLTSTGDALIVYVRGVLSKSGRHDITGITANDPRNTALGTAGTCWFTEDVGQGYDGKGAGAGFYNTSSSDEGMLLRNNIGFYRLNFGGAFTNIAIRGSIRFFTTAQFMELRQCRFSDLRPPMYLQGAANWGILFNEVVDNCTASTDIISPINNVGTFDLIHCTSGARLMQANAGQVLNMQSCINTYSHDRPHCVGTVNINNTSLAVQDPATAGDSDWFITSGSGNRFSDTAIASGWFVSSTDLNLTSTGNGVIGALGVGTGTAPTLATDINGTARGSTTAAMGAFEYITPGGSFNPGWALNSNMVLKR